MPQSKSEDSQIDLLTLSSAMMLTVMCLLLSQVLREKSRSVEETIPNDDIPPAVFVLSLRLELPLASLEPQKNLMCPSRGTQILLEDKNGASQVIDSSELDFAGVRWQRIDTSPDRLVIIGTAEIKSKKRRNFELRIGLKPDQSTPVKLVNLWKEYTRKALSTHDAAVYRSSLEFGRGFGVQNTPNLKIDLGLNSSRFLLPQITKSKAKAGTTARVTGIVASQVGAQTNLGSSEPTASPTTFWYAVKLEETA